MTQDLPGRVTDPLALRALSHPTRWKLIELLGLETTATATQCAEFTGESVASCSYHLGILAKYGFVEPADPGPGREKPWRATSRRLSVSSIDLEPEAALAAETVSEVYLDHEFTRQKEYGRRISRESRPWQDATGTRARTLYLTAEEMATIRAEVEVIFERYGPRTDDPTERPADARPVKVMLSAYLPLPPPGNPEPTEDDHPEHIEDDQEEER
jgi:Helix-turn-helix domain